MTRLPLIALAAAMLSFAACSPPKVTTDAQANPTAAATPADLGIDGKSSNFVSEAVSADMFEIAAARLALTNTKAQNIKDFAQQMIEAHTATTAALTPLATDARITPPSTLNDKYTAMIEDLKKAKPEDFDKKYLDQSTSVHNDVLGVMKDYADNGKLASIKTFAAETAPKVQMHLDMAKGLDKSGADDPKKNKQPT